MGSPVTMAIADFKQKLDQGRIEFLLDLRLENEFEEWRIEGVKPVETLNIPQVDFVGEEEKYFPRLPKDREIFVVCAHGDASRYVAEQLRENGFRAASLEGGMDGWSDFYETHTVNASPEIIQIYRVAKGCITHVVISDGKAVVIDCVRHIDRIKELVAARGAELVGVFDTHLQADHVSGGRFLAEESGADYYINEIDAAGAAYDFLPLQDATQLDFGDCSLRAFHSPGHTPGSVSLLLNDKFLFSGDTIMKSSVGRPDLGGMAKEWSHLLYDTLFVRFKPLSDEIIILPTHTFSINELTSTGIVKLTLGEARSQLELYNIRDEDRFAARIKSLLLDNPPRYQDIRQVNLGLLAADETKMKELEIGHNLCGMAK